MFAAASCGWEWIHWDALDAGGRLHLPEETRGDHGLKPSSFWDQTCCNPRSLLQLLLQLAAAGLSGVQPAGRMSCGAAGQHRGVPQRADNANSRGHDLQHILGGLPCGNIPEPFSPGTDFLPSLPIALSPSSGLDHALWFTETTFCPETPGDIKAGKGILLPPRLSGRGSAGKQIQHCCSVSTTSLQSFSA